MEPGPAMNIRWKLVAAAVLVTSLGASLGGCAGGGSYFAEQPGPNHPFSNAALSDDVFVDGTGKSARRDVAAGPTRYYEAAAAEPGAPTRAVARSRPLAIERSDAVSGSTTGSARGQQAQNDPNKPFSDAWWENERREDARLKAQMNICRGC
jgi:hypothetical protein